MRLQFLYTIYLKIVRVSTVRTSSELKVIISIVEDVMPPMAFMPWVSVLLAWYWTKRGVPLASWAGILKLLKWPTLTCFELAKKSMRRGILRVALGGGYISGSLVASPLKANLPISPPSSPKTSVMLLWKPFIKLPIGCIVVYCYATVFFDIYTK